MEENRKRQGGENAEEVAGKRARTPATSDERDKSSDADDEDITAWLSSDEDGASELAKLLETEATEAVPVKVRFIDDPYSLPLVFQSSSYITINCNEESCGSSFSDCESSVMAGIDIVRRGCCISGWFPSEDGGASSFDGVVSSGETEAAGAEGSDGKQTNGCDCSDIDDEMLARFIGEDLFE